MDLKDNWTVAQTSQLIASYKTFPNLWDCSHKYYKNKSLRKNCLRNIAKEINGVKPGCTINDVRAKLKTLRSQYGKEKRRREFIVSKKGIHSFEPKLWCYEEIKFIDDDVRAEEYIQDEEMEDDAADDALLEELMEEESSSEERKIGRRRRPSRFPSWTKEQTVNLLRLLKESPLIYDPTHPLYVNNFHRTKAFREMLVKLKAYKPEATMQEMRAKLKTIRSQYLKEKRMLKVSTDRRGRVKYIPKLWCFEMLKFLDERGKYLEEEQGDYGDSSQDKDFEVCEPPDDCYVLENENEIYVKSYDDSDDDQKPSPMTLPESSQLPHSILHEKCLSLVESLTKQMNREQETSRIYTQNTKTPQAMLGRMVEVELHKVSESIFQDTKWKIIKLLEEASRKNIDGKLHRYMNAD